MFTLVAFVREHRQDSWYLLAKQRMYSLLGVTERNFRERFRSLISPGRVKNRSETVSTPRHPRNATFRIKIRTTNSARYFDFVQSIHRRIFRFCATLNDENTSCFPTRANVTRFSGFRKETDPLLLIAKSSSMYRKNNRANKEGNIRILELFFAKFVEFLLSFFRSQKNRDSESSQMQRKCKLSVFRRHAEGKLEIAAGGNCHQERFKISSPIDAAYTRDADRNERLKMQARALR